MKAYSPAVTPTRAGRDNAGDQIESRAFRGARFRLPLVEYSCLALLLGIFVCRAFLPAWRSLNTDFRNYYVAAQLYREGSSLLRVYDFTWFQRQKDHLGMQQYLVGFVPDTLLSALPIVPLTGFSPLTAKRYWLVINALLLGCSAFILVRITELGWRRTLIVVFLAIEPLAKSFLYGQMHLFVFFLVVVAVWCSERDRPASAGIFIALAAALKLYPALFIVFFVRKKQWRAAAGTVVGLAAMTGVSVYLFGWGVHRIYVQEILPRMAFGENIDPYSPTWNSLTALLHRALITEPGLNPHPLINTPGTYAVLHSVCQAAIFLPAVWLLVPGKVPRAQAKLEWAMFTAMLMALSTGPLPYHLCILILTGVLGLDALLALGRRWEAYCLLALYGLICFPLSRWTPQNADGWHVFMASPRLYPLLALPFFLYGIIYRLPLVRNRWHLRRQEAYAFGAALAVLCAVGVMRALHHVRGQSENYSRGISTLADSLLDGEPAENTNGLYFTRMDALSPSFRTWHYSEKATVRDALTVAIPLPPTEDEFHPTAAPGLADVWVERAGPTSNIVRLSNVSTSGLPRSQIEVSNAEQPSISPDGRWLAFIRERHGRGELWIKDVGSDPDSSTLGERQLVNDRYDVWEAAIEPDGQRIIFTAVPNGRSGLYSLDMTLPGSVPKLMVTNARYPAFSWDGKWVAFSVCEQGSWHLYAMALPSGSRRRLTDGECNSTSPVWEPDSKHLVYASDCGRGLNMTALVRIPFPHIGSPYQSVPSASEP